MSDIKVKVCGLAMLENVQTAGEAGADFVGFVFHHHSPRNITPKKAVQRSEVLSPHVQTVAVIVDKTDEEIANILYDFRPHYLQLHGNESVARVEEIKDRFHIPVIKAISVSSAEDINLAKTYENSVDMLLFDAKAPFGSVIPGGNGTVFDWELLRETKFSVPWFLSGGLNVHNIGRAISVTGATMVDVSSGVERSPGVKDSDKIREFIAAVKGNDES